MRWYITWEVEVEDPDESLSEEEAIDAALGKIKAGQVEPTDIDTID